MASALGALVSQVPLPVGALHVALVELGVALRGGAVERTGVDTALLALVARGVPPGCARAAAVAAASLGATAALRVLRAALDAGSSRADDAVRVGAVRLAGALFGALGPESGALLLEAAESFGKMVRSSKTLRDAALDALRALLGGLGSSARLTHEATLKALRSAATEKVPSTRAATARCLSALGVAGDAATAEAALELLLRLMEDPEATVYADAQAAAHAVLSACAGRDDGALAQAVKSACVALKKTHSTRARAGLGYAVTQVLFAAPLHAKEDGLAALVSVLLGLLLGAGDDVLQLRAIAAHALRHGLGKTLGTSGRRACVSLLLKSVEAAPSTDWVRVAALCELAQLLRELGEELGDQTVHVHTAVSALVAAPFAPLRQAAIACLVAQAGAAPERIAAMCQAHLPVLLQPEGAASHNHALALAALLAQGARADLGLPDALLDAAWEAATPLCDGPHGSGWAVLGSLCAFGGHVVTPARLAQLMELLRASLLLLERPANDKALLAYARRGECALSALRVLMHECVALLRDEHVALVAQLLTAVLASAAPLPKDAAGAVGSAVLLFRMALYDVFLVLPVAAHAPAAVALLKLLAADLVEGPQSTLVRGDLHADDYVLESLAHASDTGLLDMLAPDASTHAVRDIDWRGHVLFRAPPATCLVDKAVLLFPLVFASQSPKRQAQVVAHFVKCAAGLPAASVTITLNALCALGRFLQRLTKSRGQLGPGATLTTLAQWLKQCAVHPDPLLRRTAVRVLGQLCRSEGGSMTATVLKQALAIFEHPGAQAPPPHALAGAAQIVGALHKLTGAITIASYQEAAAAALLKRLDVWSLHALWLVIEARGPGFAPMAAATLDAVYGALAGPLTEGADVVGYIQVGRVVNAIVSVLGLDLQPGSQRFRRFNALHTELCAHPHALVQKEALHFQQMLILFAPRTVDIATLVLRLRRELRSSYVSLRAAAVVCTNQLLQLSPSAVVEQRLERELFYLLDNAADPELNEQLQRLIGALVDVLALAAPSRLVRLCRDILEAKEQRRPRGGEGAFQGPTGDEGKLGYADDDDDDAAADAAVPDPVAAAGAAASADDEMQSFMPSSQTKRYCLECVGRVVSALRGRPEHFDLVLARRLSAPEGGADYLVFSLRELVNMASRAAASSVHALRREGVLLMEALVSSFAASSDPDADVDRDADDVAGAAASGSALLLKQYESPIATAISACFDDAPPSVVAAACRVSATFLASEVFYDPYTLKRLGDRLLALLSTWDALPLAQHAAWYTVASLRIAVLQACAHLAACRGANAARVAEVLEPQLPQLRARWSALLRDAIAVALPHSVAHCAFPATFFRVDRPVPPALVALLAAAVGPVAVAASLAPEPSVDDRNLLVGVCVRALATVGAQPQDTAAAVAALSALLRNKHTCVFLVEAGLFPELLLGCRALLADAAPAAVRLACVRLLGVAVAAVDGARLAKGAAKWTAALEELCVLLAALLFRHIPWLLADAAGSTDAPLPGQLPDAALDVAAAVLVAWDALPWTDAAFAEANSLPVLRLAVRCLCVQAPQLDAPALALVRRALSLEHPQPTHWVAALASLCRAGVCPSPAMLQACVALVSMLPAASQPGAPHAALCTSLRAALSAHAAATQTAALGCLRALLETALRAREANAALFQAALRYVGELGDAVAEAVLARGHGELGLPVVVLALALATAADASSAPRVLGAVIPVLVALLAGPTHDSALAVLLSLAQSHGPSFKDAAAQLAPARTRLLQDALKRRAEAEAAAREAEARKHKVKQAQVAPARLDLSAWGKKQAE